ncbi:MAG: slipin family protein [Saccharofermentans sp.]|nr:slipin family protein [Saccharofermentans sp.]
MKKVILNQNAYGILVKDGRFVRTVAPGKYHIWGNSQILETPVESEIKFSTVRLSDMVGNKDFDGNSVVVDVPSGHIAVHMLDGMYHGTCAEGKHAFWKAAGNHEFTMVNVEDYQLEGKLPENILRAMANGHNNSIVVEYVEEGTVGVLFIDSKFDSLLEAGRHVFYVPYTEYGRVSTEVVPVMTGSISNTLPYQEVLTSDKAEVRVNMTVSYKVTDPVKYASNKNAINLAFNNACKLSLRESACNLTLDQLLESREALSESVANSLRAKGESLGIEVEEAGIMDMVLPGNIRAIMNTVLEAEKKAQANVILRREEVASTRSLLNTAKMMDDNPTLYRLKELECLERICGNVDSLNVASGETLNNMLSLLKK